jgi:uncharacterized repeat protein (TIGR03806 family)
LDLQQMLADRNQGETITLGQSNEAGLLGLAFHPDHTDNRYFYVAYTVKISEAYYQRVSRFEASEADPNRADATSEFVLIEQFDRDEIHNGGDLHFGPDGYLYYSAGDEGGHVDPNRNSQKIDGNFFGGIFRIDVDKRPGNLEPTPHPAVPTDDGIARYSVPADNPFVHATLGGQWDGTINGEILADLNKVRTEFWAFGLRNPWRMSFDSLTGVLWVGDVSMDRWEEVNIVEKGGNYGWVHREAKHAGFRLDEQPPEFNPIDPIYEYPHTTLPGDPAFKGNCVIGGVVYRGSRFPQLYGAYIFADTMSGNIWALWRDESNIRVERIASEWWIASVGVDPSNGDILFANINSGHVLRLTSGTQDAPFPESLSDTGLFGDVSHISPNPGLLPYEPNLAFWSDHAAKKRWFAIPDGESRVTWSRDGNWEFPSGMLWVKHFDLELERGNPLTTRRIETRVLVKTESGAYGVSYHWNEDQTEAALAPDEGVEFDIEVMESGELRTQRWQIPSRASCLACHTEQAGYALSFTTRQLNRIENIHGFVGNQLELLNAGGFFSNTPDSPNVLPRHIRTDEISFPLEVRVRSYLAVNCAYCHTEDGTGGGAWDARAHLPLATTKLINGPVNNNGGDASNKLVVPGSTAHSVVLQRVAASNGFSRMPPLATNELDQSGIALLTNWINNYLPSRKDYDQWRVEEFGSPDDPDGDPEANPDADRIKNHDEFVAGTRPSDPSSFFEPEFVSTGDAMHVEFDVPADRLFHIETSTDLERWTLWDVPGNDGIPRQAGRIVISGTIDGPIRFFRVRIDES